MGKNLWSLLGVFFTFMVCRPTYVAPTTTGLCLSSRNPNGHGDITNELSTTFSLKAKSRALNLIDTFLECNRPKTIQTF